MIHVNRSQEPVPEVLSRTDRNGLTEIQRAIKFFENEANRDRSFPFKVYREKAVKAALERLFKGKCAYCESRYAGTQPMDVEHWRPKGEVHTEAGSVLQGYYWLAAEWHNLFPSCIDCNRRRKYSSDQGVARARGKGNLFPLDEGSAYAAEPGQEHSERPLLLNPCEEDSNRYPEKHLQFIDLGVVTAVLIDDNGPSPLGEKSIEVYNLNRTELVHDRQEIRLQILQRLYTFRQLNVILDDLLERESAPGGRDLTNLISMVEDLIAYEIRGLLRFMDPSQPFSLMARQLIEASIESM